MKSIKMDESLNIRNMEPADLEFTVHCTSLEGWLSETREIFEIFHEHDPGGCLVAELDGQKIGICVATGYGKTGFIGELIVLEEFRRRGIGRLLLDRSIEHLHGRGVENILLDGDIPAVPLYERTGFRKICRSLRYVGRIEGGSDPNVRGMKPGDLEGVYELDLTAFGADRGFFLERRFGMYPELCKVHMTGDTISGYIMGQRGRDIVSAGPWVISARNEKPGSLLESLALEVNDTDIRLGILETNKEATETMRSFRTMESREPSWRMVLGPSASLGSSPLSYAIGSAAKG
jgi:ribosomal protein S18 acetylase RimI-like enzyme